MVARIPPPRRRRAPTVEEWLRRRRVIEERRAEIALMLETGAVPTPLPCPRRVMTEAERTQLPRAALHHRSAGASPRLVTTVAADPYGAKKRHRDE